MDETIYKIATRKDWQNAEKLGHYAGAPVDLEDGFIHFSRSTQLRETAAKHFAAQTDLLLIGVDAASLGPSLKYEPSRGGDLFPHLYGPLALNSVTFVCELPLGQDGVHCFPEGL